MSEPLRYSAWIPAGDGEKFGPTAWDGNVGKPPTKLTYFGATIGWATIVSADTAADGSGVTLTFDIEMEQPS